MDKREIEQERARRFDEQRRFAEMVRADRQRGDTLARVRAEFERRAAQGDDETRKVIADLDAGR